MKLAMRIVTDDLIRALTQQAHGLKLHARDAKFREKRYQNNMMKKGVESKHKDLIHGKRFR